MFDQDNYKDMLVRCTRCSDMCLCACPVFDATKVQSTAPSNLAHIAGLLYNGILSATQDVVETLYQCIGCRLCTAWCIYDDIILPDMLHVARAFAIDNLQGGNLPSFVARAMENSQHFGSPYEPTAKARNEKAAHSLAEMDSDEGDVLFFAGCTTRMFQPEIGVAALKVLETMGVNYVFSSSQEPCCGGPLVDLGLTDLGKEAAEATKAYIEASGCGLVLTSCPHCAYSLTEGFQELGLSLDAEVMHITAYLERAMAEGRIAFKTGLSTEVTFDDSPYMARYLGLVDAPRNILAAIPGVELAEMASNREMAKPSTCYLGLPDPATTRVIVANRLDEARRTGTSRIVTSSPFSKRDLSSVADDDLEITDIIELVAENLLNS